MIEVLISAGAKLDVEGGALGTALQASSWYGELKLVRLLVEKGASVNACGGSFGGAISAACYMGHLSVVEFLIGRQANVSQISEALFEIRPVWNNPAATIRVVCADIGTLWSKNLAPILLFLSQKFPDLNFETWGKILARAAYHDDMQVMKFLFERGADPNTYEDSPNEDWLVILPIALISAVHNQNTEFIYGVWVRRISSHLEETWRRRTCTPRYCHCPDGEQRYEIISDASQ